MPSIDLRSFVARAAALVDSSPPTDRRETRTWLVEPFLETLGWDCRADSCVTDRTVDGTRFEYVPTIDSVPALFVAVDAADESLDEARANAIRQTMAWTGVDRAIYTNGHEYLFLSGTTNVEYRALRRSELADSESTVGTFSRGTLGRRLEQHSRTHVARRLAVERSELVDSIVDRLADSTVEGEVYTDEFESAADRFVDQLVVAFAEDESESPGAGADVSIQFTESSIENDGEPSVSDDGRSTSTGNESKPRSQTDGPADAAVDGDAGSDGQSDGPDRPNSSFEFGEGTESSEHDTTEAGEHDDTEANEHDSAEDGEYVVRLFSDRGSIGAIGHSTSKGALVQTAEYLFERGLAGVEVPWSPDGTDGTVLNAEPTSADGSSMTAPVQLTNGVYLDTGGDVDDRADRIEALATRAGLRAMLTGDWE